LSENTVVIDDPSVYLSILASQLDASQWH